MLEATVAVAEILRHHRIGKPKGQPPKLVTGITLRPAGPVMAPIG